MLCVKTLMKNEEFQKEYKKLKYRSAAAHLTSHEKELIKKNKESFNDFLYSIKRMDEIKGDENEPIVVHYNAGVGGTRTFISMYFFIKK